MEFKGTNKDWKVKKASQLGLPCIIHAGDEIIFHCYGERAEYNAKLSIAAKDLLESLFFLKKQYEQLVDSTDCGSCSPRKDDCVMYAEQAINKALR